MSARFIELYSNITDCVLGPLDGITVKWLESAFQMYKRPWAICTALPNRT